MALILVEILGRLIPVETGFRGGMRYLRYHPTIGFELDPSIGSFSYRRNCLEIPDVTIDQHGNRPSGPENINLPDVSTRIAVLGDSFMMGREVSDGEHFSAILQGALTNTVVENYGVSGYGTIQQYLSYRDKASKNRPNITVLAFFSANDVSDNSAVLTRHDVLPRARPVFNEQGTEILYPALSNWQALQGGSSITARIHRGLMNNLFSYYIGYTYFFKPLTARFDQATRQSGKSSTTEKKPDNETPAQQAEEYWWERNDLLPHIAAYQQEPDDIWEPAWRSTERALVNLADEVSRQNGHLFVMMIPNTQVAWLEKTLELYENEFGEAAPPGFDLSYPTRRLEQLAAQNNFSVLDLDDSFTHYLERHDVPEPALYFRCDGHWNPVGHYIAAQTLISYLEQQGLVSRKNPDQANNYMESSPQTLLGEDAANAIYTWGGNYTGQSEIATY
ncbi:MAG: SGNH/GDSL hydrolase family protein [Gammaproteobacteria bacterium]